MLCICISHRSNIPYMKIIPQGFQSFPSPSSPFSPPSPCLFPDTCALNDLMDLASESDPCHAEPRSLPVGIPFKLRSDFYPVGSHCKDMDLFQKLIERDLTHLARKSVVSCMQDNLTVDDSKTAIKDLKDDDSIVIRNADKGGLVVIMDSKAYKIESMPQLSDSGTYTYLRGVPTQSLK